MKKVSHSLAILFLILFFFFSRSVRNGDWVDFDFAATVKIQEKIDKSTHLRTADFVANLMEGSTFLASPGFSVFIVLILSAVAVVDIKNKKIRLRGLIIPFLFGLLVLGEIYGKTVVHHPSPPFAMIKNSITIFPAEYINEQYSYPSGHVARAVFLGIVAFYLTMKQWSYRTVRRRNGFLIGFFGLVYIILVSVSRIYLGHHWLSDVIGGMLLGGLCGFSVVDFSRQKWITKTNEQNSRSVYASGVWLSNSV